jgi:hypothetical protein
MTMPEIEYDRVQWVALDVSSGPVVTLLARPEHAPRAIAHFDQIEPLLAPGMAATDPIEPLADALVRSLPW